MCAKHIYKVSGGSASAKFYLILARVGLPTSIVRVRAHASRCASAGVRALYCGLRARNRAAQRAPSAGELGRAESSVSLRAKGQKRGQHLSRAVWGGRHGRRAGTGIALSGM